MLYQGLCHPLTPGQGYQVVEKMGQPVCRDRGRCPQGSLGGSVLFLPGSLDGSQGGTAQKI